MDQKPLAPSPGMARGKPLGESSPPLGWFMTMTSSFLWLLCCGKILGINFGHLTALGGLLYPLISTGAAGVAGVVPGVAAGLWSLPLACPFCTENILRQPQGDSAVDDGAKVGPSS